MLHAFCQLHSHSPRPCHRSCLSAVSLAHASRRHLSQAAHPAETSIWIFGAPSVAAASGMAATKRMLLPHESGAPSSLWSRYSLLLPNLASCPATPRLAITPLVFWVGLGVASELRLPVLCLPTATEFAPSLPIAALSHRTFQFFLHGDPTSSEVVCGCCAA